MVLFCIKGGELTPNIEVPDEATVLDMKLMIQTCLGIEVSRQTLLLNDRELSDDLAIGYLGLKFASVLLVVAPLSEQPKFSINVRSSTQDYNVKVKETYTVADLKKKLEKRTGISSRNMQLSRAFIEMKDDLPLSAYYVWKDSSVQMINMPDPR